MQLTGIHHISGITANPAANLAFYTQTLGLRLVKKTVNQDDVSAYHLFYADGDASPGTDITFFDYDTHPERRGSRSITRTGFRVASDASIDYWAERFRAASVTRSAITERDGRRVLDFEDGEGQRLSIGVGGADDEAHPWAKTDVPAEHQIRGLGPVAMSVAELAPTEAVLLNVLNMRRAREYVAALSDGSDGESTVHVYKMGSGGPAAELHVAIEPSMKGARSGAGGMHHVAFRVPTFEEYDAWAERLASMGMQSSGPVDRFYFRSLYFREPGGILFELATDGPGFASDEPKDKLGERLALPPFLEPHRVAIEAGLKPL